MRNHWWAIDATRDSGTGCPQAAQVGIEVIKGRAVPEAAMTEQGRVGTSFLGHFESFRDTPAATCR